MAAKYYLNISSLEERGIRVDWTDALPSGVTVSSLTATHTPPSGSAAAITHDVSAAPITWTYVPSGLVQGKHTLAIVATTSNTKISPEVYYEIVVDH